MCRHLLTLFCATCKCVQSFLTIVGFGVVIFVLVVLYNNLGDMLAYRREYNSLVAEILESSKIPVS